MNFISEVVVTDRFDSMYTNVHIILWSDIDIIHFDIDFTDGS